MRCHNATCCAPPQLQRFDLSLMSDLDSLLFHSLPCLSLFLSPTDTHPSLSLFLSTCHYPNCPPPPVSLQNPDHNTQLKTMCPKATYSEPQDRLRDFRDCLWVLYTIRYLCHAAYLSLHRWTHIFLSRLSRLPAGFLYIHEVTLYGLSFSFLCILLSYLLYYF